MLKTIMVTTAITGLAIGSALAQSATERPSTEPAPGGAMTAPDTSAPNAAAPDASGTFINSQRSNQYLASNFKGTDVIGADDKKIGDVNDILFDKDGKIDAYVVGVGGFLGIGAKDVALAPSAFAVVPGDKSQNESDKLRLSMTKEQLQQAANFEPYKAPTTTGSRTAPPATRPAPAAPAQ